MNLKEINMLVKQFKYKREKSKLQRQQTCLWQVVDVELPYIGTKLNREKSKLQREKTTLRKKSKDNGKIAGAVECTNGTARNEKTTDSLSHSAPTARDSPTVHLPEIIVNAKLSESKRRNLQQDRLFERQLTTLKFHSNRKNDKEKRVPLKGWEPDWKNDDGIVAWSKRVQQMESKRDDQPPTATDSTKKAPTSIDNEHYFPINYRCPGIDDLELFHIESLHPVFHPKIKKPIPPPGCDVKLRLTQGKLGVLTHVGFLEDDVGDSNMVREITTYRDSTVTKPLELDKRSKSVQDLHARSLERSNSNLRIKRLLKFSKDRQKPAKADEDDDEGYCSKTSSAEQRCSESDGEEDAEKAEKQKMYSSMVDLTELPSNSNNTRELKEPPARYHDPKTLNEILALSRGKFNYTHQPTILQLPNPDINLTHDKLRVEKKADPDDHYWSYARLKRSKELHKCYKSELAHPTEESTVYSIDQNKPVTLVLRKISIQNSGQQNSANYRPVSPVDSKSQDSIPISKPFQSSSRAGSVAGSVKSRVGSAVSRAGSALSRSGSRAGSSASQRIGSPPGRVQTSLSNQANPSSSPVGKPVTLKYTNNNVRDVRVVDKPDHRTDKESMWSPQFSFIERQTTNYCIGDLLPAMDKNIYNTSHSSAKLKLGGVDDDKNREDLTKVAERLQDYTREGQSDDGYLLLKKGMDMLTGAAEKPTLGPPPFRPNQTRHPLMRIQTAATTSRSDTCISPLPTTMSSKKNLVRVSSEKGTRTYPMTDEERETQKKLKEAFSEFYRNRSKEITTEFRRMQTMWKT